MGAQDTLPYFESGYDFDQLVNYFCYIHMITMRSVSVRALTGSDKFNTIRNGFV